MEEAMRVKIAREVEGKLLERRKKALEDAREKKAACHQLIPELQELDLMVGATAARLSREAICAKDPEKKIWELRKEIDAIKEKRNLLLADAGLSEDELRPKFFCPLCEDRGYIGTKNCKCYEEELRKARFARSNLGKAAAGQNFENFSFSYYSPVKQPGKALSPRANMEGNVDTLKGFAANFDALNNNILLYGGSGLGKTHLSSAVANLLLDAGKTVIYETAGEIFSTFEAEKFSKGGMRPYSTQDYFDCDLLVVDDLGSEFGTSFVDAALFNIVNTRGLMDKKLIINTNLKEKELDKRYSERTLSRLRGCFSMLEFYGDDIRVQKRLGS